MPELADIFRRFSPEYLKRFGDRMLPGHLKAVRDIIRCRTPAMKRGGFYTCECGAEHYAWHSCGSRACPKCGGGKTDEWLRKQEAKLLPADYYLVTFTLPAELRPAARSNQRVVYGAFFKASSEALKELALDRRFLGAKIGMTGMLQTWKRDLGYHVHIHYVVPGGGLSADGRRWVYPKNRKFLVAEKPLAVLFRNKLRDLMREAGLHDAVPPRVWSKGWCVDCINVGNGRSALKYLLPYVHRTAISNNRMVSFDDRKVVFRFKPSGANEWERREMEPLKFLAVFLQHVPPSGFMRIRHYGILASACSRVVKFIQLMIISGRSRPPPEKEKIRAEKKCPRCGGTMTLEGIFFIRERGPPVVRFFLPRGYKSR